jgi:O-antigen ligase
MRHKEKAWWGQWDRIILFLFVLGSGVVSAANALRTLGILLVLTLGFLLISRVKQRTAPVNRFPPELICYTLWVMWTGVTGYFIAQNLEIFWMDYWIVLQILVMIWTIYGLLRFKLTPQVVFFAGFVYTGVQVIAVLTGLSQVSDLTQVTDRITGLTNNPNGLGFLVVTGLGMTAYFWQARFLPNLLRKGAILGLIALGGYVTAISGSRKSLLLYGAFLVLWGVFILPHGRGVQIFLTRLLVVAAIGATIVVTIPLIMEGTAFGTRWNELTKGGQLDVGEGLRENVRYEMYTAGLQMFRNHPFAGVGLGQYKVLFATGAYSHSDIIEPLATTGGVGFLLYQSFYLILLVRLRKLYLATRDRGEQYRLKVMGLGMLVILLFGLGMPHICIQPVFIYLATLSAYTWTKLHEARAVPTFATRMPFAPYRPPGPYPVRPSVG